MARKKAKRLAPKKITKTLDIPEDVFFNSPRITMMSNKELRLENYTSILLYEENQVSVSTKDVILTIQGEDFSIEIITDDEFTLAGNITSMEFSQTRS